MMPFHNPVFHQKLQIKTILRMQIKKYWELQLTVQKMSRQLSRHLDIITLINKQFSSEILHLSFKF